jgi:uncharacterized protein YbjT (DUF2867 family)
VSEQRVILVTGATGTTGSALARILAQAAPGAEVRLATRDPRGVAARRLAALGPDLLPVPYVSPDDIRAAAAGATHVYALPPFDPAGMDPWHQALADAVRAAGTVRLIVKHSVQGARLPSPDDAPSPVPAMHARGEAILRGAAPLVTLRPTIFAQHVTRFPWVFEPGGDALWLPTGGAGIAWVDARDVARLAAHLLLGDGAPGRHGGALTPTGPESVTAADMAAALSAALGRPVRHVDADPGDFADRIERMGGRRALAAIYAEAAEGHFAQVTGDVARVTGLRETSFAQFAYDHRDELGGSA